MYLLRNSQNVNKTAVNFCVFFFAITEQHSVTAPLFSQAVSETTEDGKSNPPTISTRVVRQHEPALNFHASLQSQALPGMVSEWRLKYHQDRAIQRHGSVLTMPIPTHPPEKQRSFKTILIQPCISVSFFLIKMSCIQSGGFKMLYRQEKTLHWNQLIHHLLLPPFPLHPPPPLLSFSCPFQPWPLPFSVHQVFLQLSRQHLSSLLFIGLPDNRSHAVPRLSQLLYSINNENARMYSFDLWAMLRI